MRGFLVLIERSVAMDEKSDRRELRRRLEQTRRAIALLPINDVAHERLQKLAQELEEQLRLSE
jgi:hypothetical protein